VSGRPQKQKAQIGVFL